MELRDAFGHHTIALFYLPEQELDFAAGLTAEVGRMLEGLSRSLNKSILRPMSSI